jgi:hypothetical protein
MLVWQKLNAFAGWPATDGCEKVQESKGDSCTFFA